MTILAIWLEGTRPKTLIASVSPVLIGTTIALEQGKFHFLIFLATLLFALLIQIGTNFANDYFDFLKGADTKERKGPRRLVQSKLVTPKTMKLATHLIFTLAGLIALYLVSIGGLWIAGPLLLSILLGYLYTAGPYPLAYLGISDLFVFVFFGLIATTGTTYLQTGTLELTALIAGMGPGFLSMAILVLNNMRDIEEDRKANKKTLPVRFGLTVAKFEYTCCLIGAALIPVTLIALTGKHALLLLTWAFLIPGLPLLKTLFQEKTTQGLVLLFPKTGKLLIIYTLLFVIGYLVPASTTFATSSYSRAAGFPA